MDTEEHISAAAAHIARSAHSAQPHIVEGQKQKQLTELLELQGGHCEWAEHCYNSCNRPEMTVVVVGPVDGHIVADSYSKDSYYSNRDNMM